MTETPPGIIIKDIQVFVDTYNLLLFSNYSAKYIHQALKQG